jgi:hypothetical protein
MIAETRPGIITASPDDAECFDWFSDGWFQESIRHTPEAQALMVKAKACITAGKDVPDVVRRLEEAGFTVTRQ